LAGLSSFGFGGTNAHLILSQAPPQEKVLNPATVERPKHLLALSAKSEEALQALLQRYAAYLDSNTKDELSLADLVYTTNTGRNHFKHRLAVVAESTAQLREQLASHLSGQASASVLRGQLQKRKPPKIAFLFTGQGSQYVQMGRQLYETQPTFRQVIDRCDEILSGNRDAIAEGNRDAIAEGNRDAIAEGNRDAIAEGNRDAIAEGNREGLPLLSVLYPEEGMSSPLDETLYTQPALFALEYALAKLWQSWGITPDVVMGHSVGEIVAACVAGVFSLEDGLKLIAERARLMEESERGEMVAAFASEEVCLAAIQPDSGQVSLAAINGPENTVISGQRQAVKRVVDELHRQGIKTTTLKVSHAFHSPLMDPILDSFERVAREVRYSTPKIKIISNLTGQLVSQEITTAEYWVRHIRQPVRFADGVRTLQQQKMQLFLEIGPKPTLLGMARRCAEVLNGEDNGEDKGSSVTWLPSLRQGRDDWSQMLHSLGQLYVQGVPIDWSGFEQDYIKHRRRLIGLPTYPWQRKRYWIEPSATETHLTRQPTWSSTDQSSIHPLLGQRLPELAHLAGHHVWQIELKPENLPYLNDHRIQGTLVVAGVVYVEMVLAAANEVFGGKPYLLNEIEYQNVLVLPEEMTRTVQISLSGNKEEQMTFHIHSRLTNQAAGSWTLHATGRVVAA
jgi:acyl transferase domain-containing protein